MNKIRFDFLDGFRGLAALWVVLFHSMLFNGYSGPLKFSPNVVLLAFEKFLSIGQLAVAVFIILSGFCLAIPVVNNNLELKGGFKRYIFRRAKRLLPPYYIALIISLIMALFIPLLSYTNGTEWDSKLPITAGSVTSHFLVIHNLSKDWIYKINGALWSIATEWQIYFLFPVMLFLWKKTKLIVVTIVFAILSVLLQKYISFAVPEFIFLFLMGVICCYFSFRAKTVKRSWIIITAIIFIASLIFQIAFPLPRMIANVTVGLSFSLLLYTLISYRRLIGSRFTILENKPVMFLGKISYSLYLIHGPFLALANLYMLKNYHLSDDIRQIFLFGFVIVVVLPIATAFYYLVERRFLNS